MGHELWTSEITGYRRVGTRYQDVRELFIHGINVKSIYEPLRSCPIQADALEMKSELIHRDFDVAGVVNEDTGDIVGYVITENLQGGEIRDFVKEFHSSHLISDSTPLAHIYRALGENNYLFVLTGTNIEGIVTLADLNKPPVRIYLFGIISLLEMHMTFWINKFYDDQSWVELISDDRVAAAEILFQRKKQKNQEISMLDCIQFGDKKVLISKNEDIRKHLGLPGRNHVEDKLRYAEELRNNLAHSQFDLAAERNWSELFQIINWIEATLVKSDSEIEKMSKEKSEEYSWKLS